jgi:hypothetical protein
MEEPEFEITKRVGFIARTLQEANDMLHKFVGELKVKQIVTLSQDRATNISVCVLTDGRELRPYDAMCSLRGIIFDTIYVQREIFEDFIDYIFPAICENVTTVNIWDEQEVL